MLSYWGDQRLKQAFARGVATSEGLPVPPLIGRPSLRPVGLPKWLAPCAGVMLKDYAEATQLALSVPCGIHPRQLHAALLGATADFIHHNPQDALSRHLVVPRLISLLMSAADCLATGSQINWSLWRIRAYETSSCRVHMREAGFLLGVMSESPFINSAAHRGLTPANTRDWAELWLKRINSLQPWSHPPKALQPSFPMPRAWFCGYRFAEACRVTRGYISPAKLGQVEAL